MEQFQVQTNDLRKLQQVMRNINIRSKTCVSLDELLNGEIYLMDVDKAYTKATIAQFIEVSPPHRTPFACFRANSCPRNCLLCSTTWRTSSRSPAVLSSSSLPR